MAHADDEVIGLAGIAAAQADQLDIPDQQASFRLRELAETLAARLSALRPRIVVTHAYEGGHPEFLHRSGCAVTTLALDERERALKQRLVDCFLSQRRVLADFPIEVERFRPAPAYDFTRPPHPGPLYYEQLDWGVDGPRWRALADQALATLAIKSRPCA